MDIDVSIVNFFRTGRLFFGRNKVMAKALGTTPEDEYKEGLSKVSAVRPVSFIPTGKLHR